MFIKTKHNIASITRLIIAGIGIAAKLTVLLLSTAAAAAADADTDDNKTAKKQQMAAVAVSAVAAVAQNADQQDDNGNHPTLSVNISGLDAELKKNAEAFLDIWDERGKAIKNPSYIRFLSQSGGEQIKQALQPFGYYVSQVETTLDEQPTSWTVNYQVQTGEPVRISKTNVSIEGEGKDNPEFQQLLAAYPLKTGDVLLQEKYTAFKNDLTALATTEGYFDADFSNKKIILSDDLQKAEIILTYDTGKRYTFAEVSIKQDILDQDVFERYQTFEPGELYSTTAIADLQRDLYNSGYVKTIDVSATPDRQKHNVPVELAITPKKRKKHRFAIGYGSDDGVHLRYDFDWRWVNRRGHSFSSNLFASQELQEAGAQYRIPGRHPATDYYKLFANVKRDHSGDIEATSWSLGGGYVDQKGNLTREFGIEWQQEDFTIGNDSGNIGLLTPYARLTYRKVDNVLETNDGLLLETWFTGAHEAALSDITMLQARARAKYIKRLSEPHKITLTAAAGRTWTDDFHQLPPSYRFFSGGDKTIRGYRYEIIGDRDSSGDVIGGDKMFYGSAEYEYFFKPKMAAAVFVDAGDAYATGSANLKIGAGVGFHYYSPIGPIKVDVAHGVTDPGSTVRLHLSIGPDL